MDCCISYISLVMFSQAVIVIAHPSRQRYHVDFIIAHPHGVITSPTERGRHHDSDCVLLVTFIVTSFQFCQTIHRTIREQVETIHWSESRIFYRNTERHILLIQSFVCLLGGGFVGLSAGLHNELNIFIHFHWCT